ncbi:MAG: hypothetical protein DRR08_30415 [Candidatus Parabeggiatoa sp. nov. 2]|nr:MAG: hypothetical protein B6247_28800 [Beggiatoa sp. 4572_84]RKZ50313.1 MAG: hypothetical protein DRR08_30415 [Gammaproteobacteria bacterium]
MPEKLSLAELTKEMFSDYLGETFRLHLDNGDKIDMTLEEVTASRSHPIKGKEPTRQPFSILFCGPPPVLPQRMYTFEQEKMGMIENRFIVPIGEDQKGVYYQAVFS